MKHGTPKETENRDAAIRERRIQHLADTRATFTSDHGKRVLDSLRDRAALHAPATVLPASGGPIDPLLTAWRDGRKSIILEILADLEQAEDRPPAEPKAIGHPAVPA